jgi:hypothetical protein
MQYFQRAERCIPNRHLVLRMICCCLSIPQARWSADTDGASRDAADAVARAARTGPLAVDLQLLWWLRRMPVAASDPVESSSYWYYDLSSSWTLHVCPRRDCCHGCSCWCCCCRCCHRRRCCCYCYPATTTPRTRRPNTVLTAGLESSVPC